LWEFVKDLLGHKNICLLHLLVLRFWAMKRKKDNRASMKEGDRILINKGISRKVMIIARIAIPHSNERIFVTKSGGKYTIGLKVWRSDYAWSEKNQMWMPKR
jgi:hypothetical protein